MDGCRLSKEAPQALGYLTSLTNLDIQLRNSGSNLLEEGHDVRAQLEARRRGGICVCTI